jgi:RimJ/RimL family protein N-acetyltransferase
MPPNPYALQRPAITLWLQSTRLVATVPELGSLVATHHAMHTPPLDTPRLTLRPYQANDLEPFVALNTDLEVRRHVGGPFTPADATRRFQSFDSGSQDEAWAVTLRGGGRYIGHCWLVMRDDPEIGFLLIPSVWRQGYGTEVAVAVLDYALTQRQYSRVVATVDADRPASIRVLERAGMRRQREQRDEQGAYFVYLSPSWIETNERVG